MSLSAPASRNSCRALRRQAFRGAFQHDVIEFAGGVNTAGNGPAAYFACNPDQIRAKDPDIIFYCGPDMKTYLENDALGARCGSGAQRTSLSI